MDTSVEAALTRVQGLLRKGHTESEQTVVWLAPPGRKDERALGLSRQEDDALSDLEWSLNQDPRFDHLKGKPHDVAVGFLFECDDYPTRDNAPAFLAAHAKSLETAVCYIPVEYLSVPNETTVYGVRLLPPTDASVPKPSGRYTLQPPVGSVAAIDVAGTDYGLSLIHISEPTRLGMISYAVFCLKKKKKKRKKRQQRKTIATL